MVESKHKQIVSPVKAKLFKATVVPMATPIKRLMNVAVPDIFKDSHVIPITSESKLMINSKALMIP